MNAPGAILPEHPDGMLGLRTESPAALPDRRRSGLWGVAHLALADYAKGQDSTRAIAGRYGISTATLTAWVRGEALPSPPRGRRPELRWIAPLALADYRKEPHAAKAIAARYGVHLHTLRRWVDAAGYRWSLSDKVDLVPIALADYREGHDSANAISARHGIQVKTLRSWVDAAGLPRRPRGRQRSAEPTPEQKDILRRVGSVSLRQLGEQVGLSKQAIHQLATRWPEWVGKPALTCASAS